MNRDSVKRTGAPVRAWLISALPGLALAGCTEVAASRLGDRTYRIEGPGLPSESVAPNRRVAERVCPKGYRVMDEVVHRNSPDGIRDEPGMFVNWTIRCI
jgi:hypothetical protein